MNKFSYDIISNIYSSSSHGSLFGQFFFFFISFFTYLDFPNVETDDIFAHFTECRIDGAVDEIYFASAILQSRKK